MTTEDGLPLEAAAAVQGLTLRLAPPGSSRANEIVLTLPEGT